MKAIFSASDALGNPVPRAERDVVSSFECAFDNYVLGVWEEYQQSKTQTL